MNRSALALGAMLVVFAPGCGQHAHLTILVGDQLVQVRANDTLDQAVRELGLRAPAGNLLDVDRNVLRAGVYPGRLLLNGRRAEGGTHLKTGDRISLRRGRDRMERVVEERRPVPGGISGTPQGRLVRTSGVQVVVRGAVSHKVVSSGYRATEGPVRVEHAVALTFDDGPSPTFTPQVLRVLRRMHVHATFFVIGFLADAYPDLVRQEHQAGMAIGNHTYNHPEVPPFKQLPRQLLDAEIQLGAQSLTRIGVRPALLRPPAGSTSPKVVAAAERAGERVVLWSVDPTDWPAGVTAPEIKRRVLGAVQPGSIVLLHDGGGDRSPTVKALPGIIKGIRHRHLRLVTITAA
jgi:peptidoglycan-N-acetylglucosamine deacetylase